ncbi:hypothetical protein EAI75_04115 [Bifidobacterium longum]|jgi:hypothetical protein|uniref:Uncharacterized protein n=2 Tax=Bifidobacterium longum TaxID=216816 RepID=A0A269TAQ9_BIFLN|nr:hypothetical protein [Bifidobacterium longum]ACD98283.1 Hypothetical protein BLD_0837 [Bifidobacterium longum DJO10A]AEI97896.1 hypothetical protein BLNIAS_01990 [Bifidobacterium longum subsp. longum KACC 91563]KEY24454.1 hypothetical protein BL15B_09265 [Bifidobacterium longum subsp. longum 1-5B]KEY32552.1 hypothetical protein EK13BL_03240 [Bifidobacterium longum subsp. longum EK13]MBS5233486.1 hypothetical protein [Collinsella sp.]CBK70801.1 hypothetical protein BIL_13140 [Bifidobacteriu
MLGTAPPPRYLTSVQVSRRHLFLDFALGCRRLSFMVSSIITANDGGRTTDENLSSWAPSATCNSN